MTSQDSPTSNNKKGKQALHRMRKNQQKEDDEEEWQVIGDRRGARRGHSYGRQPSSSGGALSNFAMGAIGIGVAALGLGAASFYKAYIARDKEEGKYYTKSVQDCIERLKFMQQDIDEYPILGFDVQRKLSSNQHTRSKIAVLQLCTCKGNAIIIPLQKISSIPEELKNILIDESIIKTGVDVLRNANFLREDFGLEVSSTFDLRCLAKDTGNRPDSLKNLAWNILEQDLDSEALMSDWEVDELDKKQVNYAVNSVKAINEIFKTLYMYLGGIETKSEILEFCRPNLNKAY